MARLLNGSEVAAFVKERQAKQVRMLRQAHGIAPTLLILKSPGTATVIDAYVRMKQRYAADIGINTLLEEHSPDQLLERIHEANNDEMVHGILVQLPLADEASSEAILGAIAPEKDVDGLSGGTEFISATAEAIDWLLGSYGIELAGKQVAIIGNGRLVGAPLARLWQERGLQVAVYDQSSPASREQLRASDVIVTATGAPGVVASSDIKPGAVVVDAGTAGENGVIIGDLAPDVYTRTDITMTPQKGGVGPLTVVLLFDHVIRACLQRINQA